MRDHFKQPGIMDSRTKKTPRRSILSGRFSVVSGILPYGTHKVSKVCPAEARLVVPGSADAAVEPNLTDDLAEAV